MSATLVNKQTRIKPGFSPKPVARPQVVTPAYGEDPSPSPSIGPISPKLRHKGAWADTPGKSSLRSPASAR